MAKHIFTRKEIEEGRAFLASLPSTSGVVPSVSLIDDIVTWQEVDFTECIKRERKTLARRLAEAVKG